MKAALSEKNIPFAFADISTSMAALKSFLVLRDTDPLFADVRGTRTVGVPLLVVDGVPHFADSVEDVAALIGSGEPEA